MKLIPHVEEAARTLSKNAVQQEILIAMFRYFNNNHDDQWDVANFIAALRKGADHIESRTHLFVGLDMPTYISLAMGDWALGGNPYEENQKL